jgi:integrase
MLGSSDRQSLAVDGYTFLFEKLLARAALPHIHIHDLRYTAGSLMLAQGVPAPEVAHILGHANIGATHRLSAYAVP